ncbi:hypothetical protein WN48_04186 [Eufriesea mexicana]|uniref:Uncharacterized protein n=1 Tax=Eufriesea mexicana TaxID=516756 RepID=A0A310SCA0_9HYME|nr:hypothetical protein WN48_04186 [Eufriesea mexicana]
MIRFLEENSGQTSVPHCETQSNLKKRTVFFLLNQVDQTGTIGSCGQSRKQHTTREPGHFVHTLPGWFHFGADRCRGSTDPNPTFDDQSMISIRSILEATGATRGDAERAAIVIQAAFRGHYERMVLNEAQGKVQWQRAVTNTLDILKKAGATAAEISKATRLVKFAYRGYYTRRNQKMGVPEAEEEPLKKDERILEPVEAVQAVAWMEMMYEDSGLTLEKANEAASIIQKAYKMYRARRHCYDVQQLESTKTMVADAVIDKLHQRIFKKVTMSGNIPVEYGTRDEIIAESTKFQVSFKEKLRVTRLKKEGHFEHGEYEEGDEEQEDKSEVEDVPSTPVLKLKPKYRPVDPEIKLKTEDREEQLTEGEETEGEATETEITLEQSTTSPELQSEIESERPTDSEFEDHVEKDETGINNWIL